ncbi:predicted protein [Uncinocarpus reesii 1704]|uniref:Hydrophobin n=1 Tax=Uncinocarpus reesii (strain UAMH 1704) TaxID=336963 RepID=C4JMP3_UNCRE|nr:uncharacterized protein UREG_04101 [Uncinocarpus reesii 1704]EEP79255.1 predicted protein [Uncinocarpus reesii 1704]
MKVLNAMILSAMLPSALAGQYSFSKSCSTTNGVTRCCPGNMSMRSSNGVLSGYCCVPVQRSKRDNGSPDNRIAIPPPHARSRVVARDGQGPCSEGEVAVPVNVDDFDKRIDGLMGRKGAGNGQTSAGANKGNPVAFAGALGMLAAAGV